MTREEFEARMGNTVTPEAWAEISDLYCNSTDVPNWDAFIDDYKLHGTSKILRCIWGRFKMEKEIFGDVCKSDLMLAAERLVDLGKDEDEAYDLATKLVGQNYIVSYKVAQEKPLNKRDRDFLLNLLG